MASLLTTDLHLSRVGQPDSQAGSALATLAGHPERALRLLFTQCFRNQTIGFAAQMASPAASRASKLIQVTSGE